LHRRAVCVVWCLTNVGRIAHPSRRQRATKAVEIYSVVRRFTSVVRQLASTIVLEMRVPVEAKRIKPSVGTGGVAGGEK
jgi:hypothetical protein